MGDGDCLRSCWDVFFSHSIQSASMEHFDVSNSLRSTSKLMCFFLTSYASARDFLLELIGESFYPSCSL